QALRARASALVAPGWDRKFDAAADVALEDLLPTLDVDVVVTCHPGLLVAAVDLLPPHVVVVHQDHRGSTREGELVALRAHLPRADVLVVPSSAAEDWW